jgi:hypothetical protein
MVTTSVVISETLPTADSTDAQREMVRRARERFGPHVYVNRDGRIEGIRYISLGTFRREELTDRLYEFLERNSDLLGIENARQELPLSFEPSSTVRMHQVANGLEVLYGSIQFDMILEEGTIFGMSVNYYPEARDINPTPTIDSLRAGEIAQADPRHGDAQTWVCCYELFISRTYDGVHEFADGDIHLIWKVVVGEWVYMVDAHGGEIMDARYGSKF